MAERRMFSKSIIDSDAFLDMPISTQALYFHLSMRADDDGFVNSPNKIIRTIGVNKNDFDLLVVKDFIFTFESGVIVMKHWKINNYLRSDRYTETTYLEEKKLLTIKENGVYLLNGIPSGIPVVGAGKDSIGKDSINTLPHFSNEGESGKFENEVKELTEKCFNKFYLTYPKKVDKKKSKDKYAAIFKNISTEKARTEKATTILNGLRKAVYYWQLRYGEDTQYIPSPLAWLHGEKWNDIYESKPQEPELKYANDED